MKILDKVKENPKLKFVISYYIIFLLVLAICSSMARYTNNVDMLYKINIAQFDLEVQDASTPKRAMLMSSSKSQKINLNNTVIDDGYGGKLFIPGSKGIITLNLNFAKVETAVNYRIVVDRKNLPENLKFYVDKECSISIDDFDGNAEVETEMVEQKIYWSWEFTESDEGKYINNNMDITVKIQMEQKVVSE